jgi:hypothetical protein
LLYLGTRDDSNGSLAYAVRTPQLYPVEINAVAS